MAEDALVYNLVRRMSQGAVLDEYVGVGMMR